MDWEGERESENVEDRRGGRIPGGAKGLGLGAIVVAVLAIVLGGDPQAVVQQLLSGGAASAEPVGGGSGEVESTPEEEELVSFVKVVLASTEDVWNTLLPQAGTAYREPKLVLFRDAVDSACGTQGSAVGPFYCPGDSNAYIDLGFFETLRDRLGAPGDFARAYVLAHEVGHHVQNLLGTSTQVQRRKRELGEAAANDLSVRLELQADFYAGLWAHHAQAELGWLDAGDLEEALNAAAKIGDDHLQRQAGQRVAPDSFTHGTSAQRVRWFRRGFEGGRFADGDTFSTGEL